MLIKDMCLHNKYILYSSKLSLVSTISRSYKFLKHNKN